MAIGQEGEGVISTLCLASFQQIEPFLKGNIIASNTHSKRNGRGNTKGVGKTMNWKQRELAQELFEYVKKKFPHITFIGYWERPDGMVYIEVASPYDDGWEIIEYAGERSVEILLATGQQVMIGPYDNVKSVAELAVRSMRPELALITDDELAKQTP